MTEARPGQGDGDRSPHCPPWPYPNGTPGGGRKRHWFAAHAPKASCGKRLPLARERAATRCDSAMERSHSRRPQVIHAQKSPCPCGCSSRSNRRGTDYSGGRDNPAPYLAAVVQLDLVRGKWQWLCNVEFRAIPEFPWLVTAGQLWLFVDFVRTPCGLRVGLSSSHAWQATPQRRACKPTTESHSLDRDIWWQHEEGRRVPGSHRGGSRPSAPIDSRAMCSHFSGPVSEGLVDRPAEYPVFWKLATAWSGRRIDCPWPLRPER